MVKSLPWDDLLVTILPDLQRTEKLLWWVGRPLRIRIHLGIYLRQQVFNLTDRQAEYSLYDNAAFRLFCGYGILKKWHVPAHTKIEACRSRLLPETQRKLANHIAAHAAHLKYANPACLDIDSTVHEANISYPSAANLLVNVACLAKRLVKPLNDLNPNNNTNNPNKKYHVSLKGVKARLLHYFNLKRQGQWELSIQMLKSLWQSVMGEVWPVMKDSY